MVIEGADWPRFGWTADPRLALEDARARNVTVALATVVQLEGSAPRPVGTQMLFEDAKALGYFSGGCLEADVARHAAAVVRSGEPALLVYGRGSPWIDIRLTCGGRMEIFVERVAPDDDAVGQLLQAMAERRPVTLLSNGRERRVVDGADPAPAWQASDERLVLPYAPVPRLLVAGGDPTALAIATLAEQAGWEAAVLRPDYVPGDGTLTSISGLDACLERIRRTDPWTAIVVATHEADVDHEMLSAALPSPAFYVGVLGARTRLPVRIGRLEQGGVDTARLHAPVGIAPTGKAPWEVAVSVVGEIMAAHQTRISK